MSWTDWFLFFLIYQLLYSFGTWRLYKKAGFNPIHSLIPIYSGLVLMNIIKRPWWWMILVIIPIVNLLIFPIIWIETIRSFGKNKIKDINENNIRLKKEKKRTKFIPEIKINANQVIKIRIVCPMSG